MGFAEGGEGREPTTTSLGQLTKLKELKSIIGSFPSKQDFGNDERDLLHFAFGYGSGVFTQEEKETGSAASSTKKAEYDPITSNDSRQVNDHKNTTKVGSQDDSKMIDIILAVDDPKVWHELNMRRNMQHYSYLSRMGGPSFVSWIQDFGPGLYFHPYVDVGVLNDDDKAITNHSKRQMIKYGIISKDKLLNDLLNWDYLYVAGRLHKPTQTIVDDVDGEIKTACNDNLTSALAASLLLLSSSSNIEQGRNVSLSKLFYTIANISYAGDVRMQLGAEDNNKIEKIVSSPGQFERWCDLYREPLSILEESGILNYNMATKSSGSSDENSAPKTNNFVEWDKSSVLAQKHLLSVLPPRFHQRLEPSLGSSLLAPSLSNELSKIVAPSTRVQTLKGLISAGFSKSLQYAGAKFAKGTIKRFLKK